ncbi:hypothetical protein HQQ94_02745 [Shewanella sp. VB17]|uniref:hypothetical protein n=1 Tax=Shewanella sp. VB17 TaxID=2739432 RepID=UPI001564584F|nr:hypothetical protein [Shewanella sp. VB17]NRD72172.1 hypothetical protein [Shewanella sp. VB17]
MLYYPFRNSIEALVLSIDGILKYGEPDIDEVAPENVEDILSICRAIHVKLDEFLDSCPPELSDHPNKNFGPAMDPEEIRQVLSLIMPLAKLLNDEFPLLSYFPIRLLRHKGLFLLEVMNLYYEWKSYFLNNDPNYTPEFASFLQFPFVSEEELISQDDGCFSILFNSLQHSSTQAQRDVGREFNQNYDKI